MAVKRQCRAYVNTPRSAEWKRCGRASYGEIGGVWLCESHFVSVGGFMLALADSDRMPVRAQSSLVNLDENPLRRRGPQTCARRPGATAAAAAGGDVR